MSTASATAGTVCAPQPRALAAKGNPLATLMLSKGDPRRAPDGADPRHRNGDKSGRRKAAYAARDAAETCGRCERALSANEPVWRERCARDKGYAGGTTFILAPVCKGCHSRGGRFWRAPCQSCRRPVYNAMGFRGRAVVCSERCHKKLHKARLRQYRTVTANRAALDAAASNCAGEFNIPAFLDRRNATNAVSGNEGRSK